MGVYENTVIAKFGNETRTVGNDMYKNATEARTVIPLVLQELDYWHHNRVLATDMGVSCRLADIQTIMARTRCDCGRQTNSAHEPIRTIVDDGKHS